MDSAIKNVTMDMKLSNPEKRVIKLSWDYRRALEVAGLPDLPTERPHVAIQHIISKVKPSRLRKRMKKIFLWKKNENFHKKDYGEFIRALARVAKEVERSEHTEKKCALLTDSDTDSDTGDDKYKADNKRKRKKSRKNGRREKRRKTATDSGEDEVTKPTKGDKGSVRKAPPCLKKSCGGNHYMDKCPNTSPDEAKRLVREYKERKSQKGSVSSVSSAQQDHSALFSATFASGKLNAVVLADQGADCNFLPPSVVDEISKALPELKRVPLQHTQMFGTAIKDAEPLPCSSKVVCDVHLRIRHGTRLLLRNVTWLVSERAMPHVILGREVLTALGLDNRKLIAVACDNNDGTVDVAALMAQQRNGNAIGEEAAASSTVCSILEDPTAGSGSMFHSQGADESDGLDDSDVYINLGEDEPGEVDEEMARKVREAVGNGMTESEGEQLHALLTQYSQIFE